MWIAPYTIRATRLNVRPGMRPAPPPRSLEDVDTQAWALEYEARARAHKAFAAGWVLGSVVVAALALGWMHTRHERAASPVVAPPARMASMASSVARAAARAQASSAPSSAPARVAASAPVSAASAAQASAPAPPPLKAVAQAASVPAFPPFPVISPSAVQWPREAVVARPGHLKSAAVTAPRPASPEKAPVAGKATASAPAVAVRSVPSASPVLYEAHPGPSASAAPSRPPQTTVLYSAAASAPMPRSTAPAWAVVGTPTPQYALIQIGQEVRAIHVGQTLPNGAVLQSVDPGSGRLSTSRGDLFFHP